MSKDIRKQIDTIKNLSNSLNEDWYHGSPDAREIEKSMGFTDNVISVEYVEDPIKYKQIQVDLKTTRESGDMDKYHEILNQVSSYKKNYKYNKPVFLSDKHSVAKTYADPQRSFDYQNAEEKIYSVDVDCNKILKILAPGERFRFLNVDSVKNGFISAGVDENEIDKLISMFNFYVQDNKGIKTDVIGAIGSWLHFDCIDVIGVLDSYHGGSTKSTVKMVLNPKSIKIKK